MVDASKNSLLADVSDFIGSSASQFFIPRLPRSTGHTPIQGLLIRHTFLVNVSQHAFPSRSLLAWPLILHITKKEAFTPGRGQIAVVFH